MPHRKGSFHEDWNDMLVRFAHRGTPAALKDQVDEARAGKNGAAPADVFDPHQALFEWSALRQRPATNSQIEKARSSAAGGS